MMKKVLIYLIMLENWLGLSVRLIAEQLLMITAKNYFKNGVNNVLTAYIFVACWASRYRPDTTEKESEKLLARLIELIVAGQWPDTDRRDLQKIASEIKHNERFDLLRIYEILKECSNEICSKEETYYLLLQLNKACQWRDNKQVRVEINMAIIKLFDVLSAEV